MPRTASTDHALTLYVHGGRGPWHTLGNCRTRVPPERGRSSTSLKHAEAPSCNLSATISIPCTRVPEETALNDYYTYTDLLLFAISSGPHGHRTCTMLDRRAHMGGSPRHDRHADSRYNHELTGNRGLCSWGVHSRRILDGGWKGEGGRWKGGGGWYWRGVVAGCAHERRRPGLYRALIPCQLFGTEWSWLFFRCFVGHRYGLPRIAKMKEKESRQASHVCTQC